MLCVLDREVPMCKCFRPRGSNCVMRFRRRGSNVLCVGSADDACGGWTSTTAQAEHGIL